MQNQTKQYPLRERERSWKIFYGSILFLGLILIICEISIYRKTLIPLYIPLSILLTVGIVTYFLSRKHYKTIYSSPSNFVLIAQNMLSWGCIACYVFMASNYYLAEKQTTKYTFVIQKKSSLPGTKYNREKRQPLATINYFGFEKELVFAYSDTHKFNSSKKIKVVVKKGSLGFDILDNYFLD